MVDEPLVTVKVTWAPGLSALIAAWSASMLLSGSPLMAVIMSPPPDAFALCTPHQTEGHYSMYLSLFGRDLKTGETAQARARLLIAEKLTETEAVKAYENYLKQLGVKGTK